MEDFEQIQATTLALLRPVGKTIEATEKMGYRISRVVPTTDLGDYSVFERSENGAYGDQEDILVEIENSLTPSPVQLFVKIPPIIYSTAIDFRNRLFLITSFCGLLLIIGILIATEILFVRRIARMDQGFMNMAESGEAAPRLEVTGGDEFARLGESANRLLDALRRRRSETERQQ